MTPVALVLSALADLGLPGVGEDADLFASARFDSLTVVALVERLEAELGVEVPAEHIVPETFATPRSIAAVIARSRAPFVDELLDLAADRLPDRPAIRTPDATLTYAELAAESRRLAAALARRGTGRGDRVMIVLPNGWQALVAVYAAARLGAPFAVVSPATKPFHLERLLADAEPAVVVTSSRLPAAAGGERVLAVETDWPGAGAVELAGTGGDPGDLGCLVYTSGSTAVPKAVVATRANVAFAVAAIGERLRLRPDDTVGVLLPLSFDYGLYQAFLACAAGATLAVGDPADAGPGLLDLLDRNGVTVLPVVPSLARALVRLAGRGGGARPPLRMVTSTGAHLDRATIRGLTEAFGCAVYPMFGLTECKRVAILSPDELADHPDSVGRALPGTTCWIVDADGEPVPPGTPGELVVAGPHVMAGYWRAPEETARRFRTWRGRRVLFTGDLCRMDEEGFLYFAGRLDGVYKRRGYRVGAAEVEAAALDVLGVEDAALTPPRGEDDPAVLLVVADDPDAVVTGLRERLEDYKVPDRVVAVPAILRTDRGKIDRSALAAGT